MNKKTRVVSQLLFLVCIHTQAFGAIIGSRAQAHAVTIQSDGKIVVAGTAVINERDHCIIARYTSAGALDTTFDTDGVVTTAIGTSSGIYDLVLQSDGKIVVAGKSDGKFAVARYTSAGVLDTTFGSSGVVTITIGSSASAHAVAIQSDGKIVITGKVMVDGQMQCALARYSAAGVLDATFGTSGIVQTVVGHRAQATAIALQSDGKIVIGGWASSGHEQFMLARYTTAGVLDDTFGAGGIVITSIGGYFGHVNDLKIQSDGKILAAGVVRIKSAGSDGYRFALARYTSTGALDTTFDTDGKVTIDIELHAQAQAVVLQSDGKIVSVGFATINANENKDTIFALARCNTDGSLDTTFDTDGITTIYVGADSRLYAVAWQSNGKILAAGESEDTFSLMRFNTDGSPDESFGTEGLATSPTVSQVAPGSITFLWDQKPTGVSGGTFLSGAWHRRDLNMIAGKRGAVSLSNNTFTLQPGCYILYAKVPAHAVTGHQARLYNITDDQVEKYGSSEYVKESEVTTLSIVEHRLCLHKATTFCIEHRCSKGDEKDGFGEATDTGSPEIYTQMRVLQLS